MVEYSFNKDGQLLEIPDTAKQKTTGKYSIVHVEGELFFGAADLFETRYDVSAKIQT